jgi:predicted nucleic acid-binding protein
LTWVVDASVALKWFLHGRQNEQDAEAADLVFEAYLNHSLRLLQPPHFAAEVLAVLARERPETMNQDLRDLLVLNIPTRADAVVYARAMQLSAQLKHHLFDTLYHAVALETDGATLLTADKTYAQKAGPLGRVMLLSQWSPSGAPR